MSKVKFNAFISYNHRDRKEARKIQRKLENFILPEQLANQFPEGKDFRFKIFRYETDLTAQNLDDGLRIELDRSEYLIVICSPNSAKSYWVGREIEHFIKTGRANKIIPVIISGVPYTDGDTQKECYHPNLIAEFPKSILGIDINDSGDDPKIFAESKTIAKVAALLTNIPDAFDAIWDRYKRARIMSVCRWVAGALCLLLTMLTIVSHTLSFDASFCLREINRNPNLKEIKDIAITISGEKLDPRTINTDDLSTSVIFKGIPGQLKGKKIRLTVSAPHLTPVDQEITLRKDNVVKVERDTLIYGIINTGIIDNTYNALTNTPVEVNGLQCTSDTAGIIRLQIPYSKQCSTYVVKFKDKYGTIKMPCSITEVIMIR